MHRKAIVLRTGPSKADLVFMAMDGDGDVEDGLVTEFNERDADISRDSRWLAYESDRSGQYEIYVRVRTR